MKSVARKKELSFALFQPIPYKLTDVLQLLVNALQRHMFTLRTS